MIIQRIKNSGRGAACLCALASIGLAAALLTAACNSNVTDLSGAQPSTVDALSGITLVDQNNHPVPLASLRGKPILIDFFYTSCPGPCLMLTARMRSVAAHLGPDLGTKAWLVSVTVDPEHDRPNVLRDYIKQQGASRPGWLFLTGTPAEVERLMGRFKLVRHREADGSVDHVLEFFLIGPKGHPEVQYLANQVMPAKVAGDLREVMAGKQLAAAPEPYACG